MVTSLEIVHSSELLSDESESESESEPESASESKDAVREELEARDFGLGSFWDTDCCLAEPLGLAFLAVDHMYSKSLERQPKEMHT